MNFNLQNTPIYRAGSKKDQIHKIRQLLPNDINNFYDLFGGTGIVCINSGAKIKHLNELDVNTFKLYKYFQNDFNNKILSDFEEYKKKHVNDTDTFFTNALLDFKRTNNIKFLYYVTLSSYCNMYEFNKKGDVIASLGKKINNTKIKYYHNLNGINLTNLNYDQVFEFKDLTKNDFVFIDPPYLIASATNKKYGYTWTKKDEIKLLDFIQKLIDNDVNFMLTNYLTRKNETNELLNDFIQKNKLKRTFLSEEKNLYSGNVIEVIEIAVFNYIPRMEQISLF